MTSLASCARARRRRSGSQGGRHGEEQQRQRLRGPQETVELVVGDEPAAHAVRELHRAQRHEGDGRKQHGSLAQSPRRARASEPHDDDRHHDRKAGRAGGEPPPRHRVLRRGVGRDQYEVVRAIQASLGDGIEERGPHQAGHADERGIGDRRERRVARPQRGVADQCRRGVGEH
jgi:hypothetical protein